MKVKVYHAVARGYIPNFMFQPKKEVISQAWEGLVNGASYEEVAHVEARNLEEVFHKTNSIDQYWGENTGVTLCGKAASVPTRSTSVGDIFVVQGDHYYVDSFGFTKFKTDKPKFSYRDLQRVLDNMSEDQLDRSVSVFNVAMEEVLPVDQYAYSTTESFDQVDEDTLLLFV